MCHYGFTLQFMLRRRVLQLYKEFFRVTKQIPDETSRKEVQDWIRNDFKSKKNEKSEYSIKLLIQSGDRSLRQLQSNIAMTK